MVSWNKQQRNCPFAGYLHVQVASQRFHDFPAFFRYDCHQGMVDDEAALEFLFLEPFALFYWDIPDLKKKKEDITRSKHVMFS